MDDIVADLKPCDENLVFDQPGKVNGMKCVLSRFGAMLDMISLLLPNQV